MIFNIFKEALPDGPIEAGETYGLDVNSVVMRYFTNRNSILQLLRIYCRKPLNEVAAGLDISEKEVENYENSSHPIPPHLVPRYAKLFEIDLKTLLVVLGHAKPEVMDQQKGGQHNLRLAARYSGPELTDHEKVNLSKLFNLIIKNMKQKGQDL